MVIVARMESSSASIEREYILYRESGGYHVSSVHFSHFHFSPCTMLLNSPSGCRKPFDMSIDNMTHPKALLDSQSSSTQLYDRLGNLRTGPQSSVNSGTRN